MYNNPWVKTTISHTSQAMYTLLFWGIDTSLCDATMLVFPSELSYYSTGGPTFNNKIMVTEFGLESRHQLSLVPIMRYQLPLHQLNAQQLLKLEAFFRAHAGSFAPFLFFDHRDHMVEEQIIAIGDGYQKRWQCYKLYEFGSIRVITQPIPTSIILIPNIQYVLEDNGWLQLSAPLAPGEILRYSCQFMVKARFDDDNLLLPNNRQLELEIGISEVLS